jgi:hypothetical protein
LYLFRHWYLLIKNGINTRKLCRLPFENAKRLKGTVSRDFLLLVFFMNQFPPSPRVLRLDRYEFFQKFAEIFASQGAPPVSTTPVAKLLPVSATPVANFSTIFASDVDTGGKFATGVNDTGGKFAAGVNDAGVNDAGGKFPPVSTTPSANLPPVSLTPVANNGNNIRLQTP